MIIVGDIGGTKTNLALCNEQGNLYNLTSFPSQKHGSLTEILAIFCKTFEENILGATFAVAGPVYQGVCKATNLPWIVEVETLQKNLNCKNVFLINDLEATAYSIERLPKESVHLLHKGDTAAIGNRAVIAPGTGLGEAGLYFDGKKHYPFASEGGHTEFGPRNETELALCRYLFQRFGHASYERILSGPGIYNIYLFLRDVMKMESPHWLEEKMKDADPTKVISEEALQKSCEICITSLDFFIAILGAEASNCVLKFMATGGLYIAGGIAPKIFSKFQEPIFFENFLEKGRFTSFLKKVPISLILDDKANLFGALAFFNTIVNSNRL